MNTNPCEFVDDPARRRLWLLIKALENAPLREALALAKGAEAFLAGRADASPRESRSPPLDWPPAFRQHSLISHRAATTRCTRRRVGANRPCINR
jgi:hypothetical protein